MKRYEVTGRPLDPSPVGLAAVGSNIKLNLSDEEEAALVGAGAIRVLPEPKAKEKASDPIKPAEARNAPAERPSR